uniref:C-type lectin domain family 4 member F n=1 Tax=Myotis myotis TaxID=51298 RepID=A0A7J7U4F9_MYOMY|nr:C-type lectin domain family 4 member F [Myotis myotis]
MNGDKVRFCRDNQSVSLHPHGLNSSAVAPAAPKMSRLVLASLVFMVMIIATSLMALFVVVLQKPRPAPEAYAYSRGFLGDNSTWQLPVEPNNPYRFGVAELQESKLQEANVEVERLKGELASTKALTAKVQEQQRSLETLRAAFASQEQLQKSQNELLQLILQGWKVYNGDMYYFSHVKKSWQEAEKSCVSQGAHLASVTSAEEQAYLTEFTRSSNYWIGLNDRGTEGSWRWIDGTPFNYARSRVFWNDNQPDNWQHGNGQDEDCVHVQQKWNDNNCNALYQWICKKPLSQGVA